MRVQGLAAGLLLLAAVSAAGECPEIVPLVVVGGACAGQEAAATPTALHAQAAAFVATALQPDCPRARLLAGAVRQLRRARALVERGLRRDRLETACADQLRGQLGDTARRLQLLRDQPR